MNFNSILNQVYKKILSEKDIKKQESALDYLKEQIISNTVLNYQFKMIDVLKRAKIKLKTNEGVERFIQKIKEKNLYFIEENKLSQLKIWRENKKLLEYFNINPSELNVSLIDKALDFNNKDQLNEVAIKKYLGVKKNVNKKENKKDEIKKTFINIMESKGSKKANKMLSKQIKIIKFLGECVNREDKYFILNSLKKVKAMTNKTSAPSELKETVNKVYKLRVLVEKKKLKEFAPTNFFDDEDDEDLVGKEPTINYEELPDNITPTDEFNIDSDEDNIVIPDENDALEGEDEDDEMISSLTSRRHNFDDEGTGKKGYKGNLKHIKKIIIEAPKHFNNPEKFIVSFNVPFYPDELFHTDIVDQVNYIKKRFDHLERTFINREIYQAKRTDLFNPTGTIWESKMPLDIVKPGREFLYHVSIYLTALPTSGQTFDAYEKIIMDMLEDFDTYLETVFPIEMSEENQKEALKKLGKTQRKRKSTEFDLLNAQNNLSHYDNFGGMF